MKVFILCFYRESSSTDVPFMTVAGSEVSVADHRSITESNESNTGHNGAYVVHNKSVMTEPSTSETSVKELLTILTMGDEDLKQHNFCASISDTHSSFNGENNLPKNTEETDTIKDSDIFLEMSLYTSPAADNLKRDRHSSSQICIPSEANDFTENKEGKKKKQSPRMVGSRCVRKRFAHKKHLSRLHKKKTVMKWIVSAISQTSLENTAQLEVMSPAVREENKLCHTPERMHLVRTLIKISIII